MAGAKTRPMTESAEDMENIALSDEDFGAGVVAKTKSGAGGGTAQITGFSIDHDYLIGEQSLDRGSWMILGMILLGWALIAWAFPSFSVSYPLFFVPFAYLVYRSRTSQLILINDTIRNFGLAFGMAPIVLIVLTVFLIVAFSVFDRTGSIFATLWMIVFVQVLVEEIVKYRMIKKNVEIDETASLEIRQMQYLDLSRCLFTAMALSLGYGTYQGLTVSMLLAYTAAEIVTPVLISLVVAALYIPSHCITGYLIGLQLARKTVLNENLPAFIVVLWPVLFRSTFLFQFLFWAGTNRHPLIAWAVTSVVLNVAFILYIRHVKKKLPQEYLDNAGYNVVLGYIPIVDDPV